MLINFEKEFIWIRPTKVGSTSFLNFLIKDFNKSRAITTNTGLQYDGKLLFYKANTGVDKHNLVHPKAETIRDHVSADLFNGFRKVANIRNPYTQVVSSFIFHKMRLKKFLWDEPNYSLTKFVLMRPKDFLRTVLFSTQLKTLWDIWLRRVSPYTDWLHIDGKLICDDFIRVENYEADLKKFCAKYDYDFIQSEKLNSNKQHTFNLYDRFLDSKSIELIKQKHKIIFDKFDYNLPHK